MSSTETRFQKKVFNPEGMDDDCCVIYVWKISLQGLISERDKKTDITAAAAWPKNSAAGGGDLVIQVSSFGVGQRQGPDRNAAEREKGSRSTGRRKGLFFPVLSLPCMYERSKSGLADSGTK